MAPSPAHATTGASDDTPSATHDRRHAGAELGVVYPGHLPVTFANRRNCWVQKKFVSTSIIFIFDAARKLVDKELAATRGNASEHHYET